VDCCGCSSVFHTPQWLETLQRTYGYEPVAFTDSPPGERLENGLLFCRVSSWITGRRLVSLPFSDHCEPLLKAPEKLLPILDKLKGLITREGRRYIELRVSDTTPVAVGFEKTEVFCSHTIDLRQECEKIFAGFHKNHVQRTIRKAERSGLTCEVGRSKPLLEACYALHKLTRLRHRAPVQPMSWFQNLLECLGDRAAVHLARIDGKPAAAILTAVHKSTLVYKYGCSDATLNRYGGTSLLFWRAIQDAKGQGLVDFDLGRSDLDNEGLIAFKDHLGGRRTALNYYRYTGRPLGAASGHWTQMLGKRVYALVPTPIRVTVGSTLYRHFG
jgi:hypothetical protein